MTNQCWCGDVDVAPLTRALYRFMIMTAGLSLSPESEHVVTLLIPPPSARRTYPACHWKTSSTSPEDVETQAFSSGLQSSVSAVQTGLSVFPCHNLLFFPVGDSEVKGCSFVLVCAFLIGSNAFQLIAFFIRAKAMILALIQKHFSIVLLILSYFVLIISHHRLVYMS